MGLAVRTINGMNLVRKTGLSSRYCPQKTDGVTLYYEYDDTHRLIEEEKTAYVYNPAGQLISETTYNNAGAEQQTQHYIWLGTVPVAMLQPAANNPDPKVIYLHSDHLDTPRKATDQNQTVVWQWHSDAFGTTAANDDPDNDGIATTINLRFPGQYYDAETQLHYNYFRDYDPATGRYVQSDPIGLGGGLNTYGYGHQNPLRYIDSRGIDASLYPKNSSTADPSDLTYNPWPPGVWPPPAGPALGDIISQPNGNLWGEPQDQDNVCSLPFPIGLILDQCVLGRCQRHDACYAENQCTASSWGSSLLGGTKSCNKCNSEFFQ